MRLIEACPVPAPVLQHEIVLPDGRRFRLDTAWPELRIAAEADGRRWHSTRREFERDLLRSRAITAAGWRHYPLRLGRRPPAGRTVRDELTAAVLAAMAPAR